MSWSEKYKKSINCDNPKGFSQRAHCQGRKKKMKEAKDHEVSMAQSQLKNIEDNVRKLKKKLGTKEKDIPAWMQDKISKTHHNMSAVGEYHTEEGLRDWFGKSKSKDGKKGWVNVVTGDSCASDKPGEGIPKCVSSAKRARMSKKERLAAQRAKRRQDPGQQEKSGAAAPTMVKTDRKTKKEEVELLDAYGNTFATIQDIIKPEPMQATNCPRCGQNPCVCSPEYDIEAMTEAKDKKGKGSGSKDACYHKVKSRYSVWPSAYASGALVKCRKVGAANWGNKKEGYEFEFNQDYHKSLVEKCWVGYTQKGMKKKGDKMVPNCVKEQKMPEYSTQRYAAELLRQEKEKERKREEATRPVKPVKEQIDASKYGKTPDQLLQDIVDRKKLGGKVVKYGMKKANEEVEIQEKVQRYNELGQTVAVTLRFRGKIFYLQLFFPTVKFPNRKEVEAQVQKIYPDAVVMMAVPATVDPTKPTIRVAEGAQYKVGDTIPASATKPKPKPTGAAKYKFGVDKTGLKGPEKPFAEETYDGVKVTPLKLKKKVSLKPEFGVDKTGLKGPEKPFVEEVLPDGPAADKRNPQKPKRKTQGGDVRPGIKEQSVPVTAYNKGDKFTGRAGAMTPKEIERANEGSAERIRKTIKLANSHEPEGEMVEGAAWTKKSGKNPKGGLNEKGRKSYERENPGSDLKAPSKKVGNKRRASFCARMKGMKKKLTSAKTANDPDSRINKSLRAWNC